MANQTLVTVSWVIAMLATGFALLSFIRGAIHLWKQISSGAPDHTRTRPLWRRLITVAYLAVSHQAFKGRPVIRVAHFFVMFAFPFLLLGVVSSYGKLRDPQWVLPIIGNSLPFNWLTEFFLWSCLIAAITFFVIRRQESTRKPKHGERRLQEERLSQKEQDPQEERQSPEERSSRFYGSTRWQGYFIEWTLIIICVCLLCVRSFDYSLTVFLGQAPAPWAAYPTTAPIGVLIMSAGAGMATCAHAIVMISMLTILTFSICLMIVGAKPSMGIAWHVILAFFNLYAQRHADGSKDLGEAPPILVDGYPLGDPRVPADRERDAPRGYGTTADLTWKARLDFYTCTECGRCQQVCPAWNAGKSLSPKLLILALRDHVESASNMEIEEIEIPDGITLEDDQRFLEKGAQPSPHSFDVLHALSESGITGSRGVLETSGELVPHVISKDALWACTLCGACVEACPVGIEVTDHIINLRRHQLA